MYSPNDWLRERNFAKRKSKQTINSLFEQLVKKAKETAKCLTYSASYFQFQIPGVSTVRTANQLKKQLELAGWTVSRIAKLRLNSLDYTYVLNIVLPEQGTTNHD